jgi:hypothetical protein
MELDRHQILLSDLSLQISTVQKDVQFIQDVFPRFNLQVRKKDGALHIRTSLPNILRKSSSCVNDRRGRQKLTHLAAADPDIYFLKKLKEVERVDFLLGKK